MSRFFYFFLIFTFQILLADLSDVKQIRIVSTANVHGETDPCG